ncbi:hypothetical protein DWB77_03922 [Streptomyces hundungensis]|uniref:Uncharacterized protein n=1 Tax=Streptomyces hundungensis TaxID=1077946 RepID=A0A387HN69_9ACTN|nr:hypothetical protein [Streptomyces hundungensis]AYG81757.1 hypothetical protein DWB77_03922 [Streptomyces hundungensis]
MRTRWGRSGAGARRIGAAAAVLGALLAAPGTAHAAGPPSPSYRFPDGVRDVVGGQRDKDGPVLEANAAYRSSIKPGGKLYFQLVLDGKNDAYASAVALPGPAGAKLAYSDSIKVSIQDAGGEDCDSQRRSIGSAQYPHPFAASAYRALRKGLSSCQEPGTYYMVIERQSDPSSTRSDWGLDLRYTTEPTRSDAGPGTAPSSRPTASPAPPPGSPRQVHGGTGFHDAAELSEGQWRDSIRPGETLFFRVPLDWGQHFSAGGGLAGMAAPKDGYVGTALSLQLYNPAWGPVTGASAPYDGRRKETVLDPLAPVAYENRFSPSDDTSAMRVDGPYYLAVSLSPEVGQTFGATPYDLTLWLTVRGEAKAGPSYAGRAPDFGSGGPSAGDGSMKLLAALGIGTGTVLVSGLGVWRLLARRRAAMPDPGPGHHGFGPPGTR